MQELFLETVKLSLLGSLFALAVMLVRWVFPRAPKWMICLLWGLVALRLICPICVESPWSIVPDTLATGQAITDVGDDYIGQVDILYENDALYSTAVEAGRQPVHSGEGYYVVTETGSVDAPTTVGQALSWLWLAGAVGMLAYAVISYALLKRKMAEAIRLRDNIWQCEQAVSPFVLGILKPKIYIPYGIGETDLEYVIAHEQAHIRRADHWWKPIGFCLLAVHWFNPVLWLCYVLLCRDIEAACDEKVIGSMGEDEKRAYSTALLNCSIHRRRIAACPLAFGEVGVKERIKRVMHYKKPAFWIVILVAVASVIAGAVLLTNPAEKDPTDKDSTQINLSEVQPPKILESGWDGDESKYTVAADLAKTDLSAPGQVLKDKIAAEWAAFDKMTQMDRLTSSHLWGIVYVDTDTWEECEQALGLAVPNPLENMGWITKTGYFGSEGVNSKVLHVKATADASLAHDRKLNRVDVEAGYRCGDLHITVNATVCAEGGVFTTGMAQRGNATFDTAHVTTGSGFPVLVVTPNDSTKYYDQIAYWTEDTVFYTLRVWGAKENPEQIQNTLSRLLAEI